MGTVHDWREVAVVALFAFSVYTLSGCGTTSSFDPKRYNDAEFTDVQVYAAGRARVLEACRKALQAHEFSIIAQDEPEGWISGERVSAKPIPEETGMEMTHGTTFGDVLLAILGIILLVGIIVWLLASDNLEGDGDQSEGEEEVSSYRYEVTLAASAVSADSTLVQIIPRRSRYDGDRLIDAVEIENKLFFYMLFHDIGEGLKVSTVP